MSQCFWSLVHKCDPCMSWLKWEWSFSQLAKVYPLICTYCPSIIIIRVPPLFFCRNIPSVIPNSGPTENKVRMYGYISRSQTPRPCKWMSKWKRQLCAITHTYTHTRLYPELFPLPISNYDKLKQFMYNWISNFYNLDYNLNW